MKKTKPKILVVEDEKAIATGLCRSLEKEGYEVLHSEDGKTGLEMAQKESPNLLLLDLMLPEMDGLEVCRELRKSSEVPIIMLTAKSQEVDVVVGFELGADDYITKPFSIRELLARIKAVLRRTLHRQPVSETDGPETSFGNVEVDLEGMSVTRGDETFSMSTLEKEVLQMLLENPGKVISRNQFLNEIWGYEVYPTTRTIDFHISRLRAKVEENPSKPQYIVTVHGVGYKFVPQGEEK